MFLRFILEQRDERTGQYIGLFTLAYYLRDNDKLNVYEEDSVDEIIKWFKENLPIPTKFTRTKNSYHKNTLGLSWFKPDSTGPINKMWQLKTIIESHGYTIRILKTEKPGYIVYEDEYQVVAEPFKKEI